MGLLQEYLLTEMNVYYVNLQKICIKILKFFMMDGNIEGKERGESATRLTNL